MAGGSDYLAPTERIELEVRRHWGVLARPVLEFLGIFLGLSMLGLITSPGEGSDALDNLAGLAIIGFSLRLGWKVWEWWDARIAVTNHRIFEVSGILTRKVASMPLTKVTDMTYKKTVVGRRLHYAELVLESAGQDQALRDMRFLPSRNDDFYRCVTTVTTRPQLRAERGPSSTDHKDTGEIPRVAS